MWFKAALDLGIQIVHLENSLSWIKMPLNNRSIPHSFCSALFPEVHGRVVTSMVLQRWGRFRNLILDVPG